MVEVFHLGMEQVQQVLLEEVVGVVILLREEVEEVFLLLQEEEVVVIPLLQEEVVEVFPQEGVEVAIILLFICLLPFYH